ncbi:uncharacterized protein L201_006952 [Kwoniella dendrophila CBS 6074]|uniref:Uncharacterized protein n=1 Tax=Kwoniella dendrophila CBS 6074 TaxID=1295534 RepID=A0AAX4K4H2_9TREE
MNPSSSFFFPSNTGSTFGFQQPNPHYMNSQRPPWQSSFHPSNEWQSYNAFQGFSNQQPPWPNYGTSSNTQNTFQPNTFNSDFDQFSGFGSGFGF